MGMLPVRGCGRLNVNIFIINEFDKSFSFEINRY